jgi:hypothetical protein
MSIDSEISLGGIEYHQNNSDNSDFIIVNELTGETERYLQSELLSSITDQNGLLNDRGLDYLGIEIEFTEEQGGDFVPEGTFRGGPQIYEDTFLGGTQIVDESIEKHELRYLQEILTEILDGRYDFADIDKEFLLDRGSGMPQTLRSLFINKPGHNGGKSSIRHIFRGDKSGGLHVPAFASELTDVRSNPDIDPFKPFEAIVSINGVSKLKLVNDGTPRLEPAKTSMFPVGLDSLAVMQCVIDAWQHKGDWQSVLISKHGDISNVYEVPVYVNGDQDPINIRLITDSGTREEKIRTAFPVIETESI